MNTNEQAQGEIEYVRVSTNRPSIMAGIARQGEESPFSVASGRKIFFTRNWDHRLANGDLIALNITVIDEDKEVIGNVLVLGGVSNAPYIEGLTQVERQTVNISPELSKILNGELSKPGYFNQATLYSMPTHVNRPEFKEREDQVEKVSILNKHLDDLITQANILKEATDPLMRADAFARLDFSMDRLHRVESTQYHSPMRRRSIDEVRELNIRNQNHRRGGSYKREHGQARPGVDIVYRQSDDSFYTPDGVFMETRAQREARAWGDNRPAAQFWEQDREERTHGLSPQERLRRDQEMAECDSLERRHGRRED